MTTATKARRKRKTKSVVPPARVSLLEIASGHNGRVDSEKGIIYGVKVVGFRSRNLGRTIGLDRDRFGDALDEPYEYSKAALESAIPLYEGQTVRIDHPETELGDGGRRIIKQHSRAALSTAGQLLNVHMEEDGLHADLHLLKSHPASAFILEVAERMPDKLALSHNASGRPVLKNGRAVIEEILEVRSVDLIADKPGTNHGLFESFQESRTMKKTFGAIVESLDAKFPGRTALLEMLHDDEMEFGEEKKPVEEQEIEVPVDASPEEQVAESLEAVMTAIIKDDSLDSAAKLAKIKQILKIKDEVEGAVSGGEPAKTEPAVAAEESLKLGKATDKQIKYLLETVEKLKTELSDRDATSDATELIESMGRKVNVIRIDAVKRAPDDRSRKLVIGEWSKEDEPSPFSAPRPRTSAPLLESQASKREPGGKALAAAVR